VSWSDGGVNYISEPALLEHELEADALTIDAAGAEVSLLDRELPDAAEVRRQRLL